MDLFHGPQSTCSHVPSFLPQYVRAAGSQTLRLRQAFCLVDCSRHSLWNTPASTSSGGALRSAGAGRLTHLELAGLYFPAPAHPHSHLSSVNSRSRLQARLGKGKDPSNLRQLCWENSIFHEILPALLATGQEQTPPPALCKQRARLSGDTDSLPGADEYEYEQHEQGPAQRQTTAVEGKRGSPR